MNDDLLNKGQRDRSHIAMGQPHEVQYWTEHLRVTTDELQRAVDKVGNFAAAVRKELGLMGEPPMTALQHGESLRPLRSAVE
ncbi:DUF3606 domain-containing protein [uncultured Bradyrhizobium sp.]|uniref:DUF3606 domain-containing protein n=1 Tax=uncultured Bradyrhizobium sp. TaxID=199684 RepID=UPI0035CBB8A5